MSEPAWLTKARSYIGFHEQPGNRGIEPFIALAHCGSVGDPWCAIFANAMLEGSGTRGTRSAMARSFETDPHFMRLTMPVIGAVVTMWRGSPTSGSGHVGFYVGATPNGNPLVLAGNQSDQVDIEPQPAGHITGYWWPAQPQAAATVKRQTAITATMFGGAADPQTSAYDGHIITDIELGCALPYRFPAPRPKIRLIRGAVALVVPLVDVGPHFTDDPYWQTGTRPRAETERQNHAGIDITPATDCALGLNGKGLLDWEFATEISMTDDQTQGAAPQQQPPQPTQQMPAVFAPKLNLGGVLAYLAMHPEDMHEIMTLFAIFKGGPVPPAPVAPTSAAPVVPVGTASAPSPPSKLGFGTGILGTLLAGLGIQQGVIGPPVGTGSTLAGFLSVALPVALSVFGGGGGVASVLGIAGKALAGLVKK